VAEGTSPPGLNETLKASSMKTHSTLDVPKWLRQNKLRVTSARIRIVRLLESSDVPLTLADIHEKVCEEGCDFATVFRFVTILEQKGLVDKLAWLDGSTRHEIRGSDGHHHHHYLICRNCQKIESINECVVESLENRVAKEKGYSSVSHSLQLSGVCPSCQKARKSKPTERVA
jgi:Fur family ferric uptake transcriptional regulator